MRVLQASVRNEGRSGRPLQNRLPPPQPSTAFGRKRPGRSKRVSGERSERFRFRKRRERSSTLRGLALLERLGAGRKNRQSLHAVQQQASQALLFQRKRRVLFLVQEAGLRQKEQPGGEGNNSPLPELAHVCAPSALGGHFVQRRPFRRGRFRGRRARGVQDLPLLPRRRTQSRSEWKQKKEQEQFERLEEVQRRQEGWRHLRAADWLEGELPRQVPASVHENSPLQNGNFHRREKSRFCEERRQDPTSSLLDQQAVVQGAGQNPRGALLRDLARQGIRFASF